MQRADAGALALPAAAAGLLVVALLFGHGSSDSRLFWIGGATILVAVAAAIWRPPALSGPALGLLLSLAALAIWQALTIAWSIQPARSWDYANRGLVYFAFASLGVLLAGVPRSWIAAGLGALFTLTLLVALTGKVFPGIEPDYARLARLRWPLAYWNQLALVAALTVPLGLWLAGRRERPLRARVAGALHVYLAVVAVVLTFSRFGIALAVAGAIVWTWLEREQHESFGALVAAVPPGVVVAGIALALPGIRANGATHHERARDGAIFAVLVVAGLAVTTAVASVALRREPDAPARRRFVRAAAGAFGALVVLALVVLIVHAGGPGDFVRARWHEFTSAQSVNNVQRLGSASSGNRWLWWQQSWHAFTHHPGGGTGAGTFGLTSTVAAHNSIQATVEPHNTPLQFLTETGIVGLLLYAAAVASIVVGFLRGPRDRPTLALAVVLALGWVHSLVDIDWSFVATQAPLFLAAGVVAARPAPAEARARRLLALAAAAVCGLAVLYSLFAPWYSGRRVDAFFSAFGRGDLPAARAALDDAHTLNPLAIEPLLLLGTIDDTDRPFLDATKREPRNPETWYELATHYARDGKWGKALAAANRSYFLDQYGPAGKPGKGNVLNVARCHVHPDSPQCPVRG
ncbi:MAG: hypothetical protein E6G13_03860 [Actinobacteria bacterium]|nr:MAG: hypothetical protein E6G13_03860 [Actinomycetota bacterium]